MNAFCEVKAAPRKRLWSRHSPCSRKSTDRWQEVVLVVNNELSLSDEDRVRAECGSGGLLPAAGPSLFQTTTEGPSWGDSKVVLGAIRWFLEPFCDVDRQKLTRSLKM